MSTLSVRNSRTLLRYLTWERNLTRLANRLHHRRWWRLLFATASRLGNGSGWYALLLLLLLRDGPLAVAAVAAMLTTAAIGVLLYWSLKQLTARPRPCAVCAELAVSVLPLDQYSFPSGHTLHAVNFALQITAYAPEFGWIAIPFALTVAASRIVLGLHYLSDLVAGAVIGALLALLGWALVDHLPFSLPLP